MATLYPSTVDPKLIPQRTRFDARDARAEQLYGPGRRVVRDYARPRVQAVAHDKEAREAEIAVESELLALARSGLVPEETLERVLKLQRQRDANPLGALERTKRWNRTWEAMRLEAGGDSAGAKAVYDDFLRVGKAVAEQAPALVRRLVETGADVDLDTIRELAPIGARLREASEQK